MHLLIIQQIDSFYLLTKAKYHLKSAVMKKWSWTITCALIFALGVYLGQRHWPKKIAAEKIDNPINEPTDEYLFLSPFAKDDHTEIPTIEKFKASVKPILENLNLEISFYFRDLNNGPWFTLNGQSKFDGASLLKIPILITFYKAAETSPALLENEITYDQQLREYDQEFNHSLKLGQKYTVEQLLNHMIVDSDNASLDLLIKFAEEQKITPGLQQTIEYLGFVQQDGLVTTNQYASLLRILYNAEYLSPSMSEQALELMTRSNYDDGLTKYLPNDILVAHKYGVRQFLQSNERQLHDCGIIYKPDHPYIFCVMTRGKELNEQAEIIAKLSEKAYDLLGEDEN